MKNKKIIRFLRFIKEKNENINFKRFFYDKKSIDYRKRRFKHGYDNVDTSKMNIFQFLHYVDEKNAISNAFWIYDVVPDNKIFRWIGIKNKRKY